MARKAPAKSKAAYSNDADNGIDFDNGNDSTDLDDRMDAQQALATSGRSSHSFLSSDDLNLA